MTRDLLDELATRNPVPSDPPLLPFAVILARVEDLTDPPGSVRARRAGRPRRIARLGLALASVLVVCGVVAVILTTGGRLSEHRETPPPAQRTSPEPTGGLDVFRRAQTAKDKTLFSVIRQTERRSGLGARFADSWLDGVIPGETRYVRTISGGREVFLAMLTSGTAQGLVRTRNARPATTRDGEVPLKLIIVAPDGAASPGPGPIRQSIDGAGLGMVNNRIASIESHPGFGGCGGTTIWSLMPNGITHVRWTFPRQDRYGTVYPAPLSITVPVRGNLAIATIPRRASCDKPSVATLYDAHGHVVHQYGNPATLTPVHKAGSTKTTSHFCQKNPGACKHQPVSENRRTGATTVSP